MPEELGLVYERGIDGHRETCGLRLDDEPDRVAHHLQAGPEQTTGGIPGLDATITDDRLAGRVRERSAVAACRYVQIAMDRHLHDERPPTPRQGLRQLESLLEPAGPVDVPLGHGSSAILHFLFVGSRLRGRQRAHVSLVTVARRRDSQPPRGSGGSLGHDLDPFAPERGSVGLLLVRGLEGRRLAGFRHLARVVPRLRDGTPDLAPVVPTETGRRLVRLGRGGRRAHRRHFARGVRREGWRLDDRGENHSKAYGPACRSPGALG